MNKLRMKNVSSMTRIVNNRNNPRKKAITDNHLTPLSNPVIIDNVDTTVMIQISAICAMMRVTYCMIATAVDTYHKLSPRQTSVYTS